MGISPRRGRQLLARGGAAAALGLLFGLLGALAVGPHDSWASWLAQATGTGMVSGESVPQGDIPFAVVSGRDVAVSWDQAELTSGGPVQGYRLQRYPYDSTTPAAMTTTCTGVVNALQCTETGVPPGIWRYTVLPVQGGWSGTESPFGAAVTVGDPSLSFSSSTTIPAASLPAVLSGTITNYLSFEGLSFHLDSPTGTSLSGSPANAGATGATTVAVTIPAGTSDAPHSVFVVGAGGSVASAAVTVVDPPALTSLQMFDNDKNGRIDSVVANFSEALATPYTAGTSGWTVANAPSGATLASVSVAGTAATLAFTEGTGAADTAVGSFSVALAATSGGIRDANGHRSSFAATAPADKAAPALTGGGPSMVDANANGKVDRVTLAWSEPIAAYSAGLAPWTLANVPSAGTLSSVTATTGGTTTTLTITEGAGAVNTAVGSFTVAMGSSATGIRDAAGNQSSFAARAPADAAPPVRVSQRGVDADGNGKFDRVDVAFSEALGVYSPSTTPWTMAGPPTGSSLASVSIGGATASLNLVESTAKNTAVGSWTIALAAAAAGVVDTAGNQAAYAAVAVTDAAAPVLTAAPSMVDNNANGKVDRATMVWSEAIAAYSAGVTPWTLANVPSGGTLSSVTATTGGTTTTLTITEGAGAANTAVGSFTVAMASSATGIRDAAGNQASFTATTPVDAAKPIRVSQRGVDANLNAKFDRVDVVFSEPLGSYTPSTTPWTMASAPAGVSLSTVSIAGSTASLGLTEGTAVTTAVGSWTVALAASAAGVADPAGNQASYSAVAVTDAAAPLLVTMTMQDVTSGDGVVDRVTVLFSEALTTYSAGLTPWTLANVPSGSSLSAATRSGSTMTLTLASPTGPGDTSVGAFTVALAASASGVRDTAGNLSSFAATAPTDGAGPAVLSLSSAGGAVAGRIAPGDSLSVLLSEPLGASVALPGTTTVTMVDPSGGGSDTIAVPGLFNGARSTGSNSYVGTNNTSAAFAASPMTVSADRRTITVTVGPSCSGTGCASLGTAAAAGVSVLLAPTLVDSGGVVPTTIARTISAALF